MKDELLRLPPRAIPLVAGAAVAVFAVELSWEAWRTRRPPELKERGSNLAILIIGELLRAGTLPLRYLVFAFFAGLTPLAWPVTPLTLALCYLGVDLQLYGLHRLLHQTAVGWAFHSVHHSSERFDLSLGGRVNWIQRLFDDLFYVPLVLAGLSPALVLFSLELNRAAQYWPHTELIGRLGPLDWWLNTPSNHRVHHYRLAGGARHNYGSNFMIWDHLFGTYRREESRRPYGTDLGPLGANPLRIQFAGILRYLRTCVR